jgi:hypothetical protein
MHNIYNVHQFFSSFARTLKMGAGLTGRNSQYPLDPIVKTPILVYEMHHPTGIRDP